MATLGFSVKWPVNMGGEPTNFVNKIWSGLIANKLADESMFFDYHHSADIKFSGTTLNPLSFYEMETTIPKLHTIRYDPHNRWKAGMKIHMVVFNRSKNRFQFAPALECKSVQEIRLVYEDKVFHVSIDDVHYSVNSAYEDDWEYGPLQTLALNDGFKSVSQFCKWFNANTLPGTKIIHWTNLKY